MASPFLIHSIGSNEADASNDGGMVVLHDGTLLQLNCNDPNGTGTLYQSLNPQSTVNTWTALSQTFSNTAGHDFAGDLVVAVGTNTTDVWVVWGSNQGVTGDPIQVAHATYNGSTFTWDNTGTTAVAPSDEGFQNVSACWNGTFLIVAYRDQVATIWGTWYTYTSTKNGSAGWQAAIQLNTAADSGSHVHPLLLHTSNLAGGTVAATLAIYPIDGASGHSEQFACRVLLDSASSPAIVNWQSEVTNGNVTGQNTGVSVYSAGVNPGTGKVGLAYCSTVAGTGGVVGYSFIPITVTAAGAATFGTRVTIDSSVTGQGVAFSFDYTQRAHVLYTTGTAGTNGTVLRGFADAPYTNWTNGLTTVANQTGDSLPHLLRGDMSPGVQTYLPWYFQRGTSTFQVFYDNSVELSGWYATAVPPPLIGLRRPVSPGSSDIPYNPGFRIPEAWGPMPPIGVIYAIKVIRGSPASILPQLRGGRVIRFPAPAPVSNVVVAAVRPLQVVLDRADPPSFRGRVRKTSALATLRPNPRPIQVQLDKADPQPFRGRHLSASAIAALRAVPRPVQVLARADPKPFNGRHLAASALAALRAVPRPLQAVLTRVVPYPPGRHASVSAIAPLRPVPRPIQAYTDRRQPKPFSGFSRALSALTPFAKPPVRPLQVILDRLEPKAFAGRTTRFKAPAPVAVVITVVPRPIQRALARFIPYPAGLVARILPRTAPLRPVPRPLQVVLDRRQPQPFSGTVRRRTALTPPALPPVRAIQALLDRRQPKPFGGASRRTSALTPFAKPPVRPLEVILDRRQPKPFGGHWATFRAPAPLAPTTFVPRPLQTVLVMQPWKARVANGQVIRIVPLVVGPPLPPPPGPPGPPGPTVLAGDRMPTTTTPVAGILAGVQQPITGRPR